MTAPRFTRESLQAALSGLPFHNLRYMESTGSTNVDAAQWASEGAPHLSLLVANEQTAGRGRLQRRWVTPPNVALAFSLVLRPDLSREMSLLVLRHTALGAMAVSSALEEVYGLTPQIKWPNDVLLGRQKVAGILAEASWQGDRLSSIILGIGVNVAPGAVPEERELLFPATSIETVLGRKVDRLQLLRQILEGLLFWLPQLPEAAFVQAWDRRLAYKGEWVRVYGASHLNQELEARVVGLDPEGGLRLSDNRGQAMVLQTGELGIRPTAG